MKEIDINDDTGAEIDDELITIYQDKIKSDAVDTVELTYEEFFKIYKELKENFLTGTELQNLKKGGPER